MICPDNLNSSFTASLVHHNKNLPFSELINEPSVFGVCRGIAIILELQGLNSFFKFYNLDYNFYRNWQKTAPLKILLLLEKLYYTFCKKRQCYMKT